MSLSALQFYFFSLMHLKFSVTGVWSLRTEQFSFAILLIRLICKRAFSGENWKDQTEQPLFWATDEYHMKLKSGFHPNDCHLVHESLKAEPSVHALDGEALTKMIFSLYGLLHSETSYDVTDCSFFAVFTCFQWGFWCGGRFFTGVGLYFSSEEKKLKMERMS